ncbi:hypothetical protein JKP88DRAFT_354384 [Tribonema minus]|uniref:JmjC domain-containing protein n=1 Tax=Tribonema minus TaxID=303371 RepID=A0A835Z0K8_9STRA|nr:hypothetical protein JKP88DRAFT_354384 [Tribonema minus]
MTTPAGRARRRCVRDVQYSDIKAHAENFGLTSTMDRNKFQHLLESKRFTPLEVQQLRGEELTAEWAYKTGLREPVMVRDKTGLGLQVPDASTFTVRDVADIVGEDFPVSVIEVCSQSELPGWRLGDWAEYYETRKAEQPPLNVISLEFSQTPLRKFVTSPKMVRSLDWIDAVWPAEDRREGGTYPQVQYYCLMSLAGSYTDFHIDFGGSSVWYHVLKGRKVFYFARPTPENLQKYERWLCSPQQECTFLGDEVDACYRVELEQGNTLIIPTGWIHAVFTPQDSLVFGGNFLHSLGMQLQLTVHQLELRTQVAPKFRFPYFDDMTFYAAGQMLTVLQKGGRAGGGGGGSGRSAAAKGLSEWEKQGLPALARACRTKLDLAFVADESAEPEGWVRAARRAGYASAAAMVDALEAAVKQLDLPPQQPSPPPPLLQKEPSLKLKLNLKRPRPASSGDESGGAREGGAGAAGGGGSGGLKITIRKPQPPPQQQQQVPRIKVKPLAARPGPPTPPAPVPKLTLGHLGLDTESSSDDDTELSAVKRNAKGVTAPKTAMAQGVRAPAVKSEKGVDALAAAAAAVAADEEEFMDGSIAAVPAGGGGGGGGDGGGEGGGEWSGSDQEEALAADLFAGLDDRPAHKANGSTSAAPLDRAAAPVRSLPAAAPPQRAAAAPPARPPSTHATRKHKGQRLQQLLPQLAEYEPALTKADQEWRPDGDSGSGGDDAASGGSGSDGGGGGEGGESSDGGQGGGLESGSDGEGLVYKPRLSSRRQQALAAKSVTVKRLVKPSQPAAQAEAFRSLGKYKIAPKSKVQEPQSKPPVAGGGKKKLTGKALLMKKFKI